MEAVTAPARFSVDVPPEMLEAMTYGGAIEPRISRAEALQVTAVLRGRNLICGTLGSLPITTHDPNKVVVPGTYLLGGNINPEVANPVTMAMTFEDLLFEGVAWWKVTRFGWHNYPVEARWVPATSVAELPPTDADGHGKVYMNGEHVPDRQVIRFDSPNPPVLKHAARAIRTVLKLDRTAATYADEPRPTSTFTPREDVDPGDEVDIEAMLDKWIDDRRRRGVAYVGAALNYNPGGDWSPQDMQLSDQRDNAVKEIARAFGVDPEDLAVSTTSRTYQNAEQRRIDLLDFTLGTYVSAVQERLGMRDVLPRNYSAKIKFEGFLRSDTLTRMKTYKIGLEVGAYDPEGDEIRDLEDKPALTPAQKAKRKPKTAPPPTVTDPATRNGDRPTIGAAMSTADHTFDDTEHPKLSFYDDDAYATFRVDEQKRTISGLVVPWGAVAMSGGHRWRFAENSLRWGNASRIKLNLGHDRVQTVGSAVRLQNTPQGLDATFGIARVEEGNRALILAADKAWDGLSIEVDFDEDHGDGWQADPADKTTRLVHRARLTAVALTPAPAFDDARVAAVAAHQQEGSTQSAASREPDRSRPVIVVRART